MARAYNKNVKTREFQVGDLVLRKADILKQPGKLQPNWEGPYKIIKASTNGSYALEDQYGTKVKRPWNAKNLRKYYC